MANVCLEFDLNDGSTGYVTGVDSASVFVATILFYVGIQGATLTDVR